MENLLGKNKQLIFDFPSEFMSLDDMHVAPVRHFEKMDVYIESNMNVQQGFSHPYMHTSKEQIEEWSLHPSSLFLVCEYKDTFLGVFFSLKVKPEIFDKLVNFKMQNRDLTVDDFASADEPGSILMLSFFAMNDKSAIMLIIRYVAHLIANQNTILEIGTVTSNDEAIKLTDRVDMQHHASITEDNQKIQSLRQTLPNVLASEYVLKMLLSQQSCPED